MQTKRGSIYSNEESIQTKLGSILTKRESNLSERESIQSGGDQSSMFEINSVPTRYVRFLEPKYDRVGLIRCEIM